MTTNPQYVVGNLRPGGMLRIDDGQGRSVVVFRGLLWITQDGDPRDVFVGSGETFTIDRPGRVLIEAMNESHLLVLHGEASRGDAALHTVPGEPAVATAA